MTDEISSIGRPGFQKYSEKQPAFPQENQALNTGDTFRPGFGFSNNASGGNALLISGNTGAQTDSPASPPEATLWDELEHLGFIQSAAMIPGPVSQVMGKATRSGLLELVRGLQEKGIHFERKRAFRIPLAMDTFVPATADEVVDAFSKGDRKAGIAYSREPGPVPPYEKWLPEEHVPISSLEELRGLDGVYGAGAQALPPEERACILAAQDLSALHWQFGTHYDTARIERTLFKPYEVWRALRDKRQIFIAQPGAAPWYYIPIDRNTLFAMAMLETGRDYGVEHPDIINAIIALRDGGAATGCREEGRELDLYQALSRGEPVRIGKATVATMPLSPPALSDPPAVLKRLNHLDDIYDQYLKAPLHNTINRRDFPLVYDFCLETGTKFSPHVRAAALRELFPAARNRHGCVEMSFLLKLAKRLEDFATDELDLKSLVGQYMTTLSAQAVPYQGELRDLPPEPKPGNARVLPEHARLLGVYRRFLEAAQSEGAASDGLDLVRMPVGRESEEERIGLFLDIAGALSDDHRKHAADYYRAVLANRHPDQGLLETGSIMLTVMKCLGSCGRQEHAIDVFGELQKGSVDGEVLTEFSKTLVASGTIDAALKAARKAQGSGESAEQSITTDDDVVVIGGVSLRRNSGDNTSPGVETGPADRPSDAALQESGAPPEVTIAPCLSREELDRQYLGQALSSIINIPRDFEPLYTHLMTPHSRYSPQARAAAVRDLIPLFTRDGYLDVRELMNLLTRIEQRPVNDTELEWLVRNYIATRNERHGPYGTDADGPTDTTVPTPKDMFEELVRKEGGGELAILLTTSYRAHVRRWMADKLVESGDLSVAHTEGEHTREARASLLRRLEDAAGSSPAGADAMSLLSISVGEERSTERLALFLEIAGADSKELATCHYRALLMYRRPGQSLLEAGRRYLDLLKSLTAENQQDRTVEIFAALQSAPAKAEKTFAGALSGGSTVDEALKAANVSLSDMVMVGGAVLKKEKPV